MITYNQIKGIDIVGSTSLPPCTIYCSMDIFNELEKSCKSKKTMIDRLRELME